MQATLTVPLIVHRRIRIPNEIKELVKNNFFAAGVRMPIIADFDDTIVSSPVDKSKRLAINGTEVESPLVSLLERNIPFVVISGSRRS